MSSDDERCLLGRFGNIISKRCFRDRCQPIATRQEFVGNGKAKRAVLEKDFVVAIPMPLAVGRQDLDDLGTTGRAKRHCKGKCPAVRRRWHISSGDIRPTQKCEERQAKQDLPGQLSAIPEGRRAGDHVGNCRTDASLGVRTLEICLIFGKILALAWQYATIQIDDFP